MHQRETGKTEKQGNVIVSHPYSRTSCPLGEGVGGEGDRTGEARTE